MTVATASPNTMLAAVKQLIRDSFGPLVTLYIYMLVMLPSGSVFGINVKMICFAILLPSAVFYFLENKRTTWLKVFMLLAIPLAMVLWILIGQVYKTDITLSISEYKDIFTVIASCWLAAVYCSVSADAHLRFLRTILLAEVLTCMVKLGIITYCGVRGMPVSQMITMINDAFGVKLMGLDLESALGRVQFIADFLIPICLFMLMRYRKELRVMVTTGVLMFALLIASLVFTFSRFLWAFGAASLILALFVGKKDRFYGWVLVTLLVPAIALAPTLSTLYLLRFSSSVAGASDSVRTDQVVALRDFFWNAPLLGSGLGAHTEAIIRSVEEPYVYEVQVYALAGQLGIVGLGLLSLLAIYYFASVWPTGGRGNAQRLSLTFLLLILLSAGFTNPVLLSSAAAMSYATLRALGQVSHDSLMTG